MKKYIVFLISGFIVTSCATKKLATQSVDIKGTYFFYKDAFLYAYMTLDKNNSFVYDWHRGYTEGRSIGKWKQDGNKVIFNSYLKPDKLSDSSVEQMKVDSIKGIKVMTFETEYGYEMPAVGMILLFENRNPVFCETNNKGIYRTEKGLQKVLINDGTYGNYLIEVKDDNNVIKIHLKKKGEYYRYFVDEAWQIKDTVLISPQEGRQFVKQKAELGFH